MKRFPRLTLEPTFESSINKYGEIEISLNLDFVYNKPKNISKRDNN